jgi:ABC-type arginine transport system permease subunit
MMNIKPLDAAQPTTSQFMNLTTNSSLAMAIGYPDLLSVTDTTLNQTGQAIDAVAVAMAVYLLMCAAIALLMHLSVTSGHAPQPLARDHTCGDRRGGSAVARRRR